MNDTLRFLATAGLAAALLAGCGQSSDNSSEADHHGHDHASDDGHDHATEDSHDGHDHAAAEALDDDHDTMVSLGTATIGTHQVSAQQGHGAAAPGKELHLALTLTGDQSGSAIVRAWIGSEDRLASIVGKGEFDSAKGVYDIHAEAPTPLSPDAKWWVEIETEDGTKSLGSLALHR
ncbi:MAG: hypothetical protein ACF8R9_12315 [Phycisphaerales bacterium JB054]